MDLWPFGFGLMPVAELLILARGRTIRDGPGVAWGILAGIVAFLKMFFVPVAVE